MPTVDDFPDYPKGTVSQGPGDCIDVFDWGFDGEDGEKIVATLRQNPAGSTFGTKSGKLNFYERHLARRLRARLVRQVEQARGRRAPPQAPRHHDHDHRPAHDAEPYGLRRRLRQVQDLLHRQAELRARLRRQ
jgi:hypothetical protein